MDVGKESLLSPLLCWFLSAAALADLAGVMYGVLLALYLPELGANVAQIGAVFALSSIVPLALQVFGGWISDSIGRMRAMILGTAAGVIECMVLALAPSWYWTILALSLGGIATSLMRPSQAAFLAEQSDEEKRGRVFGVSQTGAQIVRVVGPPVGGILAGRYGFRSVFLVGGCLYAAASVLLFRLVWTTPAHAKVASGRHAWRSLCGSLSVITGIVTAGGLLTWIFVADGVTDFAFRLSGSLQSLY
jgi:MFS family permease